MDTIIPVKMISLVLANMSSPHRFQTQDAAVSNSSVLDHQINLFLQRFGKHKLMTLYSISYCAIEAHT